MFNLFLFNVFRCWGLLRSLGSHGSRLRLHLLGIRRFRLGLRGRDGLCRFGSRCLWLVVSGGLSHGQGVVSVVKGLLGLRSVTTMLLHRLRLLLVRLLLGSHRVFVLFFFDIVLDVTFFLLRLTFGGRVEFLKFSG